MLNIVINAMRCADIIFYFFRIYELSYSRDSLAILYVIFTPLDRTLTIVSSLLDITSKPLRFEKPAGKISRVSAGEIKKLKDKGFDPHNEKQKQGGSGEKIDLWKDGVENLFFRAERGSNYEPLYENIHQILK